MTHGKIRIGIGGWTYEPWRGTFYPEKLAHAKEQEFATRAVTAIEINSTYYSRQKPATFAKWAKVAPDGFVYTLKASRFCTNRKLLAEAGDSIRTFVEQGIVELGDRLGPILWQFMATKKFDAADFGAFLTLLPAAEAGVSLRHAVEVRHDSFRDPAFVALAREAGVAIVYAHSPGFPEIADQTGPFTYARLLDAQEEIATGYADDALDRWAKVAQGWAKGEAPDGLAYVADPVPAGAPRDVFVFMINGAKVRAPAAAQALIARL